MRTLIIVTMIAGAIGCGGAFAEVTPKPGPGDPRIRVVPYDPDEVIAITGQLGYQFSIEFGEDERIENVSIGDALGWQVTPNAKATLLFIKPMAQAPATNMTVVTNGRRYVFNLMVSSNTGPADPRTAMYALRFDYPAPPPLPPEPPPAPRPTPQAVNAAYSYEGSVKTLPSRVFDDGKATYFQFGALEDQPAIFAVDSDGGEAVVNSAMRDNYVVVDQIARAFVLRSGSEVTRLFNEGFRDKVAGPLSPRPREKPKSRLFWREK